MFYNTENTNVNKLNVYYDNNKKEKQFFLL